MTAVLCSRSGLWYLCSLTATSYQNRHYSIGCIDFQQSVLHYHIKLFQKLHTSDTYLESLSVLRRYLTLCWPRSPGRQRRPLFQLKQVQKNNKIGLGKSAAMFFLQWILFDFQSLKRLNTISLLIFKVNGNFLNMNILDFEFGINVQIKPLFCNNSNKSTLPFFLSKRRLQ